MFARVRAADRAGPRPVKGQVPRILCFGDGNTHGLRAIRREGDFGRWRSNVRWAGHLAEALRGSARIIEEGQPGRTTAFDDPVEGAHKNGLRILPALLETHRPVDAVIVMLGTEDLKPRFALDPEDIALAITRIAELISTSPMGPAGTAPKIVIVAPAPIDARGPLADTYADAAQKSRALAPLLAQVADAFGCGYVDAGAHGRVDPVDGVHLSRDGHQAVAQAMARYCRANLL